MGDWVLDASCADVPNDLADVFTADRPHPDELARAEAVCWRCPVRQACADYAAQVPSWGLWGADVHNGRARTRRARTRRAA